MELYKDKAEKLLGWELTEKELLQYLYEYAGNRKNCFDGKHK